MASLTLVMGNEACDLDSIACSIAYSRLLAQNAAADAVVAPLLPIPREDLALRPDAEHALRQAGLLDSSPPASPPLLFADEVDLPGLRRRLGPRRLRLVLVDHNRLSPALEAADPELGLCVAEIIDHHADEGRYAERASAELGTRRVRVVGSCATMVAEEIDARGAALLGPGAHARAHSLGLSGRPPNDSADDPRKNVYPTALARLLLGAILLDTANLTPANGRTTPEDEVSDFLFSWFQLEASLNMPRLPSSPQFAKTALLPTPLPLLAAGRCRSTDRRGRRARGAGGALGGP